MESSWHTWNLKLISTSKPWWDDIEIVIHHMWKKDVKWIILTMRDLNRLLSSGKQEKMKMLLTMVKMAPRMMRKRSPVSIGWLGPFPQLGLQHFTPPRKIDPQYKTYSMSAAIWTQLVQNSSICDLVTDSGLTDSITKDFTYWHTKRGRVGSL